MTIPRISTRLDATVDIFELFELDGTSAWALVIKQQLAWDRRGRLERTPNAVVNPVDVPWPDVTSPMHPSDLFLRKPAVDVVVAGSAVADRPVETLDVHLAIGALQKSLRVFGPRVWYRGMAGMVPSPPQKLERLPLMWEHAYGGMDVSDPEKVAEEQRNPVGIGVAADPSTLNHQPVPQIEDPNDLIGSARSRPAPAGVAALGPSFQPRRGYAGTFDQRWQDERMPLLPLDFDERFNQVAHPTLTTSNLRGGEPVRLMNIGRPGPTQLVLPRIVYQVDARTDRGITGHRPVLDTIVLTPDEATLDLVFRVAIPVRRPPELVRELLVYEKRVLTA